MITYDRKNLYKKYIKGDNMSLETKTTLNVNLKLKSLRLRSFYIPETKKHSGGKKPSETYSQFAINVFNGLTRITIAKDVKNNPYAPGYFSGVTMPTQHAIELFTSIADTLEKVADGTDSITFGIYGNNKVKGNMRKMPAYYGNIILESDSKGWSLTVKLNDFERLSFLMKPSFAPIEITIGSTPIPVLEQSKMYAISYFRRLAWELIKHERWLTENNREVKNNYSKVQPQEFKDNANSGKGENELVL